MPGKISEGQETAPFPGHPAPPQRLDKEEAHQLAMRFG